MSIYLLRHGQTDWNVEPARCQGWADVPLNEAGRAQARDRGRAMRGRGLQLIVTSHLRRARETAAIVREELVAAGPGAAPPDLPLIVDPRLAETNRGSWQTRLFDDIVREEPEQWRRYRDETGSFRFPGGERLVDHQRRVLACLRDVALDGRTAVLVTHGGSIRLVRSFLAGKGIEAFHETATTNGAVEEVPTEELAARIGLFLLGRP